MYMAPVNSLVIFFNPSEIDRHAPEGASGDSGKSWFREWLICLRCLVYLRSAVENQGTAATRMRPTMSAPK